MSYNIIRVTGKGNAPRIHSQSFVPHNAFNAACCKCAPKYRASFWKYMYIYMCFAVLGIRPSEFHTQSPHKTSPKCFDGKVYTDGDKQNKTEQCWAYIYMYFVSIRQSITFCTLYIRSGENTKECRNYK